MNDLTLYIIVEIINLLGVIMIVFLIFWLCLVPIGFFLFFLGLTIENKKLKLVGGIIFALYFIIAVILFLSNFFIPIGVL